MWNLPEIQKKFSITFAKLFQNIPWIFSKFLKIYFPVFLGRSINARFFRISSQLVYYWYFLKFFQYFPGTFFKTFPSFFFRGFLGNFSKVDFTFPPNFSVKGYFLLLVKTSKSSGFPYWNFAFSSASSFPTGAHWSNLLRIVIMLFTVPKLTLHVLAISLCVIPLNWWSYSSSRVWYPSCKAVQKLVQT